MSAEFIITAGPTTDLKEMIKGQYLKGRKEPRFAMVGRSNVGKSSLINALVGDKIAHTSSDPGKTKTINFFLWKEAKKIIADLPGYGYARASADDRNLWAKLIQRYLRHDEGLERVVVLLDARHGPTPIDLEAIDFLRSESVPMSFVFSKFDALKTQSERASRRKEAEAALADLGYDPKLAIWLSSKTGDGIKKLASELKTVAPPTESRK